CFCSALMDEQCVCGMLVVERNAWKESNVGRKFVSCVNGRRDYKNIINLLKKDKTH
ncbi:hypothetical protein AG4045_005772, partial [Apium graveolens]